MGFGPYPVVSLAEARERALEARKLIAQGVDPLDSRHALERAQASERAKAVAFDECAGQYIASQRDGWKNAKHAKQWETTLEQHVLPILGKLPVSSIETPHIMRVLEQKSADYPNGIWRDIPETASRTRNRVELILDWARSRGYREGENPARWKGHLDKLLPKTTKLTAPGQAKEKIHFEALPSTVMSTFMSALRNQPGVAALALEFAILTAARSGEVRGARWEEVNFQERVWIVPAERMKAKREHHVPLSPRAIKILETIGPKEIGLIFTASKKGASLSDMTLTAVLRRMGQNVTAHGFRSTFRDWAGDRTGFPSEVAEMALAHVIKNKAEAAYRRGHLLEKRRALMTAWADYCNQPPTIGAVVGINSAVREALANVEA
jgi:integrase